MRARWALAVASATVYAVGVPLDLWVGYRTDWFAGSLSATLAFQPGLLVAFVVGWLLVLRDAGGVIGWLLLGQWAVMSLFGFASSYAALAYAPATNADLPGARLMAAFGTRRRDGGDDRRLDDRLGRLRFAQRHTNRAIYGSIRMTSATGSPAGAARSARVP